MEAKHCLVKQQRDMCVLAYEKNNVMQSTSLFLYNIINSDFDRDVEGLSCTDRLTTSSAQLRPA